MARDGDLHRVGVLLEEPRRALDVGEEERDGAARQRVHRMRLSIAGGLQLEELRVAPALLQQLPVGAGRLDGAVRENDDAIGHAHAGKAVRDQHDGLAPAHFLETPEHLEFRARVERRRRLVENQSCASRMYARAMAIFCHSPPERSTPVRKRLPSTWS